ncbi:ABC transporter ATP-binding protein [uncultured Rhodospira sp.]|uniref:metal ABC transporter ATP-binding protein n=1 Tax=uncultured Rhodospira sp. TaxID=1936189 RepID=UPI0026254782|nr:ABC transporter ATP-binding protein [uncultured Rhodospira sp.]
MPSVIAFEDVSFRYDGTWAVEDASFAVAEGAFVAVLGPNGGGKTTLAKLITGLLRPTTGRVRVFGDDPARSARRIGYVPQAATISPAFPITAGDLVALGLDGGEGPGSWIGFGRRRNTREAVRTALASVEMAAFADRPIGALSGGQRQRVLIARALVAAPDILVLDEPTASIDPAGRSCIVELLERLAADRTVILISHDLATAVPQATAVACVNRQVLYNPDPILTEPMLTLVYGVHRPDCPMGTFVHDMARVLPVRGERAHA